MCLCYSFFYSISLSSLSMSKSLFLYFSSLRFFTSLISSARLRVSSIFRCIFRSSFYSIRMRLARSWMFSSTLETRLDRLKLTKHDLALWCEDCLERHVEYFSSSFHLFHLYSRHHLLSDLRTQPKMMSLPKFFL